MYINGMDSTLWSLIHDTHVAKTLGSMSIRYRSDAYVSYWYLIDVDPRVFPIWALTSFHVFVVMFLQSSVGRRGGFLMEFCLLGRLLFPNRWSDFLLFGIGRFIMVKFLGERRYQCVKFVYCKNKKWWIYNLRFNYRVLITYLRCLSQGPSPIYG